MKTKNIFKTLAVAMLMPMMLLTTACSNDDDAIATPTENTIHKGYALPATINVTRQDDNATTRATYNESTRKLSFSSGDQLFVDGYDSNDEDFYGILAWQSDGTFSGTIYTATEYEGTADQFLSEASWVGATLIPAGYEDYGYLTIEYDPYNSVDQHCTKAFALTKAAAVEQFSWENADRYDNGFALIPLNAIVSFTISGLEENKVIAVSFDTDAHELITGNVTVDATGVATFAIGLNDRSDLSGCELTVDGNRIELVNNSKSVEAGHIYNISRSVAPATPTLTLTSPAVGQVIGDDGKNYAAGSSLPTGVTAVAMIAYVSGSEGLAIALADEGEMDWSTAITTAAAHTTVFSNGTWKLPSKADWENMFSANGGNEDSYTGLNSALATAGGDSSKLMESSNYWSSTGADVGLAYRVSLDYDEAYLYVGDEEEDYRVRACLAF